MQADIEFLGETFEADYEGEHPWYMVRFRDSYTPSKQRKIDDRFMEVPFLSCDWNSRQACTIECELTRQELQNWSVLQLQVRAQIELVHASYPIESVAFQDSTD